MAMPNSTKMTLQQAIRELESGNVLLLKSIVENIRSNVSVHQPEKSETCIEQILQTLETFWSKHMSLATQVIAALQAQNADLKTQLATSQAQDVADAGASQQLTNLTVQGAIESPDDLAAIQAAAASLNIPTGSSNTATGTPVVPVTPPAPAIPATPAKTVPLTDSSGRTVYSFTGTPIPPAFTSAGTYTPTNTPIFYYSGDTAPGQQNGLSVSGAALVMVAG